MTRTPVTSDKFPPLAGPFSPGVQSGSGQLFISGQVGQDPATGALVDGDVTVQAHQALRNLTAVLEAAGKSLDDVVRIGVYLTDMGDFAAMNEVYREHLSAPYPARTAIAVAALPLGAVVEFDAIAS
jgi:2-iminobutanoate/2-iminopropanoate deaminase